MTPCIPRTILPFCQRTFTTKRCASFSTTNHYRLTLLHSHYIKRAPFTTIQNISRKLRRQLRQTIQTDAARRRLLSTLAAIHCPHTQVHHLTVSTTLNCSSTLPTLPPCLRLLKTGQRTLSLLGRTRLPISRTLVHLGSRGSAYTQVISTRLATDSFSTLYQGAPRPVNDTLHRGVVFLAG